MEAFQVLVFDIRADFPQSLDLLHKWGCVSLSFIIEIVLHLSIELFVLFLQSSDELDHCELICPNLPP